MKTDSCKKSSRGGLPSNAARRGGLETGGERSLKSVESTVHCALLSPLLEPGAALTTFVSPKESRFLSCPALFTMSPGRLAPSCDGTRIPLNNNDQPAQACTASSVCMGWRLGS